MIRLYSGCGTRRITSTTMVFAILVETTWPTFSFLKPVAFASSAIISSLPLIPARGESSAFARGPFSCRAASSTRPSVPCSFETGDGRTALPFHATDCVIRFRRDRELSAPSYPLLRVVPADELRLDRQLMGRQPHRCAGRRAIHAFHLE